MNNEEQLLELIRRTACELPADVLMALKTAQGIETEPSPCAVFDALCENCTLAKKLSSPLCQDTGTLTFFWRVPIGTATGALMACAACAVARATTLGYLRKNTIDALTGASVDSNVALGIPVHHFEEAEIAAIEVTLLLKGGGSENMSCQYSLPDEHLGAGRDLSGVRACVLDAVNRIQGQGCAPGILGICIGADRAEGYAVAKQQLLRTLDDSSPHPQLATLERTLMTEANSLRIGPMGLGGNTTLLGVKCAARTRLPASFFVSIAYCCWACRRQTITLL
ncbi:MAG: fumarate hydratase [Kiritimatiellia bacterium]